MISIILLLFFLCSCSVQSDHIRSGIDIFFSSDLSNLSEERVSLVMNHTSVDRNGESLFTLSDSALEVVSIFTPEHGLFGKNEAGETIASSQYRQVPVYSLYGSQKGPSDEQLSDVDILIFDMQDIGSRFYTYISTLTYVMEAAARNNIKMIVLDRVNPIGRKVQGPTLREGYESFVGMHPVPVRHGLTIGEFALLIKDKSWIERSEDLNLEIIKIEGWDGSYTNLSTAPSPNIPDLETAIVYSGLCLLEGTNMSEGRGTETPFRVVGAPWLDSDRVIQEIESYNLTGFSLNPTSFTPISMPGKSVYPKYLNKDCMGISVSVIDRENFYPLMLSFALLQSVYRIHPEEFKVAKSGFLDKLYGSSQLVNGIFSDVSINDFVLTWNQENTEFENMITPYRLYP